jgi:hypothetical protein
MIITCIFFAVNSDCKIFLPSALGIFIECISGAGAGAGTGTGTAPKYVNLLVIY